MSWFSNLAKTYENISHIVGIPNADGIALLPPEHMIAKTDIRIVIDGNGNFRRAEKYEHPIMIPCTEKSNGSRTRAPVPHPLHDQIGYLSLNKEKRDLYLSQIAKWSVFHPKVNAVYEYIKNNTLIEDLNTCKIKIKADGKQFVCFSVEILDDLTPNLWQDNSVAKAWQQYCEQQYGKKVLCYVRGEMDTSRTSHPKGINPNKTYGAKLISSDDDKNYTYRGRFTEAKQANAIGVKASHQAHAMLTYLIATQEYKCGSQAIVAWVLEDGGTLPSPFEDSLGIYGEAVKTEREMLIEAQGELGYDYAKSLSSALIGKGNAQKLNNSNRQVAVLAVDAATTGRMGVTFYQSLSENEYIERIVKWHEDCRWHFRYKGKDYISAPSVDRIIAAVYGEPKGEGYAKIKKQARERILSIILNGEKLDRVWVNAAVNRVSNPFSYDKLDGGWDFYKWETATNVACAIARKYYLDKKEVFALELDKTYDDRDYLYGRLLAIADKIESYARYLQHGKNDTEKRPTNAVRYMSAFAAKPFRTWNLINDQLNPYKQRLNGAEWYQRLIDEIMSLFKDGEYENDKPLNGKYLMGYSLQRIALKVKKNEEEMKNAEQED
jgi:CRISPR-associated protein Csd1